MYDYSMFFHLRKENKPFNIKASQGGANGAPSEHPVFACKAEYQDASWKSNANEEQDLTTSACNLVVQVLEIFSEFLFI